MTAPKPIAAGKHPKNFRFGTQARAVLSEMAAASGRTQTQVLEDLILGVRRFPPHVEKALARAAERTGLSHDELISACVSEGIIAVERKFAH